MLNNQIFERSEKKYLISREKKQALLDTIAAYIEEDPYGKSTICNLYFDTDDYRMIRNSMEKPVYKEKLRLRSYGTPQEDSNVFLELKKKYKGIVYKRRETMTLDQARRYIRQREMPCQTQIMKEIDWMYQTMETLHPAVYISYQREAYYCRTDSTLRITFDSQLLSRTENLQLEDGVYGSEILDEAYYIMEIKALKAMPLWLTDCLDRLKIYPSSYSKYGTAYQKFIMSKEY